MRTCSMPLLPLLPLLPLVNAALLFSPLAVQAAELDVAKLRSSLPAGGIAALIEPRDLSVAAAFASEARWSVHCLVRTAARRDELLTQIQAKDLGGRVTVLDWSGSRLPYAPALLTAVVMDKDAAGADAPAVAELQRVTAPFGAIATAVGGTWSIEPVALPAAMDGWPQWRYNAGRTRSSRDTLVGASDALQWDSGRVHEEAARLAIDGLLITSTTDAKRGQATTFRAYNAFTGTMLWQRAIEIVENDKNWKMTADWYWGEQAAFQATTHAGRLFVASNPVTAFDLKTGADAGTISDPPAIARIWGDGDALIALSTDALAVLDAKTLALRWKQAAKPYDLVSDGAGTIIYLDISKTPYDLVGRSIKDGKETYRLSLAEWWVADYQPVWQNFSPKGKTMPPVRITMCAPGKLLLRSAKDNGWLVALNPATGAPLWTYDHRSNLTDSMKAASVKDPQVSILAANDNLTLVGTRLWMPINRNASGDKMSIELATGKPGPTIKTTSVNDFCQLAVATARVALFKDNTWIEGVDVKPLVHQWVNPVGNNQCGTHVIPAYGRTFLGAKGCNCSIGGNHLRAAIDVAQAGDAFLAGTAKAMHPVQTGKASAASGEAATWPCFLGSPRRLGNVGTALAKAPVKRWSVAMKTVPGGQWLDLVGGGDAFTQPVATANTVLVADCEAGRVFALDRSSGKERWSRSVGGRVPAPPSIAEGKCLVGSDDGWVTCLDLASGATVWRTRAAPADRLFAWQGRVASNWPVLENILVGDTPELKGLAIAVAGRLDGDKAGSWTVAIDLATGQVRWSKRARKGLPTLSAEGLIYNQVNARTRTDTTVIGPYLKPADGSEVKSLGAGLRMVYQSSQPAVSRLDNRMSNGPSAAVNDTLYAVIQREKGKSSQFECLMLGGKEERKFGMTFGIAVAAKPTWSKDETTLGVVTATLALSDGAVIASSTDKGKTGTLRMLAAADGAERWTIALPSAAVNQGLLIDATGLIVVGRDGTISAFAP